MANPKESHAVASSGDSISSARSQFSLNRRPRPPAPNPSTVDEKGAPPASAAKLQRTQSKGGLRGMFSRTKAIPDPPTPSIPVIEEASRTHLPEKTAPLARAATSRSVQSTQSTLPKTTSQTAQAPNTEKVSRIGVLRSRSTRKPNANSKVNPKPALKPTCTPPRRTSAAWDPPPLFQAYPQAIKHATLSSSTLSADSILRISNDKKVMGPKNNVAQMRLGVGVSEEGASAKKAEKARSKHRRRISGSISKAEWTQKIYMLVTSGYLLQYSAEGSFDRLPEKMMQLGRESVAFASDVIPGKHWVLQISQSLDADGAPTPDARSLMSRLTFRGADYRRTATSFLLVLNSAEELESWIITVRREIEALGGKEYMSETGNKKPDEVMQLKAQTSQRYLVKRDPDRFSNPSTPVTSTPNVSWPTKDVEGANDNAPDAANVNLRPSEDTISATISVASHDSPRLDSLKDRTNRFSYRSSGTRTLVTSRGSSPSSSKGSAFTIEEATPVNVTEEARLRPNAMAISERRRSMQTLRNPALDLQDASKQPRPRPHSTYAKPMRNSLVYSPSTPNFSVPNAMRYNQPKNNSGAPSPMPRSPSIPRSPGSAAKSVEKTPPRATRKAPPALLINRSLPAQNGSTKLPVVYTPTEGSFKVIPHSKAAVVTIPPRSPISPRLSSLPEKSINKLANKTSPTGTSHNDFQFPRRLSSKNFLAVTPSVIPPPRTSSQSPQERAPEMVPLPSSPILGPSKRQSHEVDVIAMQSLPASLEISQNKQRPPGTEIPRRNSQPLIVADILSPPLSGSTPKTIIPPIIYESTPVSISPPTSPPSKPLPSPLSQRSLPSPSFQKPLVSPAISVRSFASTRSHTQAHVPLASPSYRNLRTTASTATATATTTKNVANRRSMPHMPPPAPPPNCALPPLPEIGRSPMHSPVSSISMSLGEKVDVRSRVKV